MKQLRVLLDTNIYGLIVVDPEGERISDGLAKSKNIMVYGSPVIRRELRETPKGRIDGINLRMDLLRAYDELAGKRVIKIDKEIEELAEQYFELYNEVGGSVAKKKIMNDFRIVATASQKDLDIVVSEDNKTMRSELALKAFKIVNSIRKIILPRFYGYAEFKQAVKK